MTSPRSHAVQRKRQRDMSVFDMQPLPDSASGKAAAVLGNYNVQLPKHAPTKACVAYSKARPGGRTLWHDACALEPWPCLSHVTSHAILKS